MDGLVRSGPVRSGPVRSGPVRSGPEWNPGGNEIFRTVQTEPKAHPKSDAVVTDYFLGAKLPEQCDDHNRLLAPKCAWV